ncbi:uncharacterized protein LOC108231284 isoform X2 [Kryptolebias marmoratus]|uniref:uncharacterized protein LOC108231284 isoform X2 n=1 Tax=Kryptolebias marmoratus TaxID=37003 RepID=UPI0007F91DD1|nr:uncharacterized protein LOC108231284 isoform X2 [Kryptolebias marmoratus]
MEGLAVFILLTAFSVIRTLEVPEQVHFFQVELGHAVTLTCEVHGLENGLFYWYKLNFGYMVQTVAMGSFGKVNLKGQFNKTRFRVQNVADVYSLTIKNISKEDEATYFCQAGAAYTMAFVNGTYLAVRGSHNELVYVNQSSDIRSVPLGTTETLQCSLFSEKKESLRKCERRAFWFRARTQSDTGLIYADKINCGQQAGRSCVYQLSKTIQKSSDTGTYYCAVVTCGEILFGEGTKVETSQELYPLVILLGVLLGCSVLVNFSLILARGNQKRVSDHSKGDVMASTHAKIENSAEDQRCNTDGEEDGLNYVALNFSQKPTRWKSKREASTECTYSKIKLSVREHVHEN